MSFMLSKNMLSLRIVSSNTRKLDDFKLYVCVNFPDYSKLIILGLFVAFNTSAILEQKLEL